MARLPLQASPADVALSWVSIDNQVEINIKPHMRLTLIM